MSQQGQAEGLAQEAKQGTEELFRAFALKHDAFVAGEIDKAQFDVAAQTFDDHMDACDALQERAARLNLNTSRGVAIADQARKPNLARPMVPGGQAPESFEGRFAQLSASVAELRDGAAHGDRASPQARLSGRDRVLVNRFLRPARADLPGARIRARLSAADIDYLSTPREAKLMNAFIDRDGGWVTAHEMRTDLIEARTKGTGIRRFVNPIRTDAMSVSFPTAKVELSFARRGRTGQHPIDPIRLRDCFGRTKFIPQADDVCLKVPKELVEDPGFDLIPFLAKQVERVRRETDELLIIIGTGAGQAMGYVTMLLKLIGEGGAGATLGIATGTDTDITWSGADIPVELIQVFDTFMPVLSARDDAIFTGPRLFERKARKFRTEPDGVGSGEFLWKREVKAGAPNTLNGFPILISEFWPDNWTSGSAGDPLFHFGRLDDYWLVEKNGMRLQVLDQLFALTNEIGYMYDSAMDGSLVLADGNILALRAA